MGPRMVLGGYRVVPLQAHPSYRTPGTPQLPASSTATQVHGCGSQRNSVVGLISVHQLSLYAHFSGFLTMTEGYNLSEAGNPNDHNVIPGND